MNTVKKCLILIAFFGIMLFLVVQMPLLSYRDANAQVESKAVFFIEDVLGFDLKRNTVELNNYYYENPEDLGGLLREYVTYTVKSESSEALIGFVFVDQVLIRYSLNSVEGEPIYEKPLPSDALDVTTVFLERYNTYKDNTQLIQKASIILNNISELKTQNITADNLKLQITQTEDNTVHIECKHIVNDLEFWNGFSMRIQDGVLVVFTDYSIYRIGSADVKMFQKDAVDIAWMEAQTFKELNISLINTTVIVPFSLKPEPVTAELLIRLGTEEPFALYPLWYIEFSAQEIQHGINGVAVGVWAHTGEVAYAHFTGYQ